MSSLLNLGVEVVSEADLSQGYSSLLSEYKKLFLEDSTDTLHPRHSSYTFIWSRGILIDGLY